MRAVLKGRAGQALKIAMVLREADDDAEFVFELAKMANEGTSAKSPGTLGGYALAQWDTGDVEGAIKSQTEVLRLCDALKLECKEEREHMRDYRRLKAEAEAELSDGGAAGAVAPGGETAPAPSSAK